MCTLGIMVLWTWGLTPVWVNVVGTVLLGLTGLGKFLCGCYELSKK